MVYFDSMCRGKSLCSELGNDPSSWDSWCPLRLPTKYSTTIDLFVAAVDDIIVGNKTACIEKLQSIDNRGITDWYIEHGQMAGFHRKKILRSPDVPTIPIDLRDPLRSPLRLQDAVFNRDYYHCRYCGNRLLSQSFLRLFIKKLDSTEFTRGATNLTTHAIVHIAWPVADHVTPWNTGGTTSLDNLVASCAACNYGKSNYSTDEMGIEDPFKRSPFKSTWDGLSSRIPFI